MNSNEILKGLKTKTFGRPLYCFPKTTSTNDVALQLAEAGASEGTAVMAEVQTRGKGRQGRRWILKESKGLAFSLVLRPSLRPDEMAEVTLAAAVAVARTLEGYRLKPLIKWPNDILLQGRKVCGILTEMGSGKDKMLPAILGVGINLNQSRGDFPQELRKIATSLLMVTGKKADRAKLFRKLLLELEDVYRWVSERRFSRILTEWRKRSATLGQQVKVSQANHVFYGQAVDVDEKGALLVRTDTGIVERVVSGDVQVLKVNSKF